MKSSESLRRSWRLYRTACTSYSGAAAVGPPILLLRRLRFAALAGFWKLVQVQSLGRRSAGRHRTEGSRGAMLGPSPSQAHPETVRAVPTHGSGAASFARSTRGATKVREKGATMATRVFRPGKALPLADEVPRLGRNPDHDHLRRFRRPPVDGFSHPALAPARRRSPAR
jgi:hypothetical protein